MTREETIKARSEFKKSLTVKTHDELKEMLDAITKESMDLDKEVSGLTYTLNADGQDEAFTAIKYFINKQKIRWDYALGMIELYEYFDKTQETITFAMLDTVLRMLGQLEFDGYYEWKQVSRVNTYFTPVAASYRETTEKIYDIAERYQAVDGQLKMYEAESCNCGETCECKEA